MKTLGLLMLVLVSAQSVYSQAATTAAAPPAAQTTQAPPAPAQTTAAPPAPAQTTAAPQGVPAVTEPPVQSPPSSDCSECVANKAMLEKLEKDVQSILATQQQLQANEQLLKDRVAVLEMSGGAGGATSGPADCAEMYQCGVRTDGAYTIYLGCGRPVQVYCDMTTDGGGWTVFQRRVDGSVDFYLNWTDYVSGFGNKSGEFWLGTEYVHLLTNAKRQRLRIDMEDFDNVTAYAEYCDFRVGSAADKYQLSSLGKFRGNAGDSMTRRALGMKFSTPDQDNDADRGKSCAETFKGAWWYNRCHDSNLNGQYERPGGFSHAEGINWRTWRGHDYSLKSTEMKIRPYDF